MKPETIHMPALIADAFSMSRSEARRVLIQGGVFLDDEPTSAMDLPRAQVDGSWLRVGRRELRIFKTAPAPDRVLLCLGPCHGEFYLPLGEGEAASCPVDGTHPVAVYENPSIQLWAKLTPTSEEAA